MQTQNVPTEELQRIVGAENVREASGEDAVDGVEPSVVVEPATIEEISEVMKLASREGLAVSPRGGGTKMGLGNPPREVDLILSTARMDEVIEHVPGDQIVRAQAGLKLEDLQEKLAESDQMLGVDPPEEGATIGGVVAANSSGPRRLRYGTVRDLIIGIKIVLADGTVAKAGGKVVKNVAGYDLSKLFTGSLGTLGVIAEANFRLHPIRETARTIFLEVDDYHEIARRGAGTHALLLQPVRARRPGDALGGRPGRDRRPVRGHRARRRGAGRNGGRRFCAPTARRSVLGEDDGDEFWEQFRAPALGDGRRGAQDQRPARRPHGRSRLGPRGGGTRGRRGPPLGPRRDRGDLRGTLRRRGRRSSRSSRRCARSGSAGAAASSCRRLLSPSRRSWTCGALRETTSASRGGLRRSSIRGTP